METQSELMAMAVRNGIDPSISFTCYDEHGEGLPSLTDWFLHHRDGTMLFISRAVDPQAIRQCDRRVYKTLSDHLQTKHGIRPFACIKTTPGKRPPLWYSFFVPVLFSKDNPALYPYSGTAADQLFIRLGWLLNRGFTHRTPQSAKLTRFRVVTNGLLTGRMRAVRNFLKNQGPDEILRHKIIAYDDGPHRTPSGDIVRCSFCPTAIIRNKKLVRCCEIQSPEGNQ